jgi:hypothetical protein
LGLDGGLQTSESMMNELTKLAKANKAKDRTIKQLESQIDNLRAKLMVLESERAILSQASATLNSPFTPPFTPPFYNPIPGTLSSLIFVGYIRQSQIDFLTLPKSTYRKTCIYNYIENDNNIPLYQLIP